MITIKDYEVIFDNGLILHYSDKPAVVSGLFLISEDKHNIYTIFGEQVKLPDSTEVIRLTNFWLIYKSNGAMYIGYLENSGLTFYLNSVMLIDNYGLLSPKGCIIKVKGEWKTYVYSFELIEDYRQEEPQNNLNVEELDNLLQTGFSAEYISYLYDIDCQDLNDYSDNLYAQLLELPKLNKLYSVEELASVLMFPEYLIKKLLVIISYYRRS